MQVIQELVVALGKPERRYTTAQECHHNWKTSYQSGCLPEVQQQSSKEPLLSHDVGSRPWEKLGAHLAKQGGRHILVVTDYFSSCVEEGRLTSTTSGAVIKKLKVKSQVRSVQHTWHSCNRQQAAVHIEWIQQFCRTMWVPASDNVAILSAVKR